MKNFTNHQSLQLKWVSILLVIIFFVNNGSAQVISNNGAYFSVSTGTVVGTDTINNTNAATLSNSGTLNIFTINNAAFLQGNGLYNILNKFTNSGTFICGTSTVNYYGTTAQNVIAVNYYNLITASARTTNNITYVSLGTIGIAGTFSNDATFTSGSNIITGTTFDFNGTGAQTIPAFTFENVTFSGGSTKTAGGNLNVLSALTLGANTTLGLSSSNIILKSSAANTARVAAIPTTAAITYGSGKFIAERYIQGRRKYRLMTSPVTTSTSTTLTTGQESLSIWGNWQNQGNNITANKGTIITGGTGANGFDQQTTTASLYTYDEVNRLYSGFTTANSKNTKYTPLKAGIAYYMFVYGDRINAVNTSTPNYTVLSSTGIILTGDQTYNTSSAIPLTNTVGNYTMLGNPFASPINWATVSKTNLYNTFWGWDPNLSSTGGYVTVNTSGTVTLISPFTGSTGLDQYIQSGQGFFVRTSAASPVLVIKESDKVAINNTNAFRTTTNNIPLIAINLFVNNTFADGTLAAFSNTFSNAVGKEDAAKIFGSAEGISIQNNTQLLSIDARQMPQDGDTIFLKTSRLVKPQYTLQLFCNQLNTSGVEPYLEDNWLHTIQAISTTDTNRIIFNVTSDAASFDGNRFRILFSASNILTGTVTPAKSELKIFPNPIIDQQINFKINELEKGEYAAVLINGNGQKLLSEAINHQGGSLSKSIYLDKKLPKGIYYLNISGKNVQFSKTIFID